MQKWIFIKLNFRNIKKKSRIFRWTKELNGFANKIVCQHLRIIKIKYDWK